MFALEITLKPSYLDKLNSPDNNMEEETGDQQSSDNKKEPDCGVVLSKCWGELLYIFLYCAVAFIFVIAIVYQIQLGKIQSCLVEFAIAMAIDQVKSIPIQLTIYWVVIRRCGTLPISLEFNSKWDDDIIFAGGIELSLFSSLRKKMTDFLEMKLISQLILGMTIFLCVVIFAELALDSYTADAPLLA